MLLGGAPFDTSYDAQQKIWSGETPDAYYDYDASIGKIAFEVLRQNPGQIAQVSHSESTSLTKQELLMNSVRVATYLRQLGIGQDDIVGIVARNSTHLAAVVYGCFFNCTAFHALSIFYDQETYIKLFGLTKPKLVFCDLCDYEKVKLALQDFDTKIYTMHPHADKSVPSIIDILQTPIDLNFRPAKLEKGGNQTLAIVCSSGTTGTPKAVTVTNSKKLVRFMYFLTSEDVQYTPSSVDGMTGLMVLVGSAIYGTMRIISQNAFHPAEFIEMTYCFNISWILITSPHIGMLLNCNRISALKLKSLRYVCYGGSSCPRHVLEKFVPYLKNGTALCGYGLSETNTVITLIWNALKQPDSVGQLLPGYQMKIVDEAGQALGPNEIGEVYCRTGEYWGGYYGNEEETKALVDADGWYHTGDVGYIDSAHYIFIVDRKKEMLKYKNIMYYPTEIEQVIAQMPEVAEVCVFGVWSDTTGDEAAAAVVNALGCDLKAQQVVDYVKAHVGGFYKELHAGAVVVPFLDKLPNGKINRRLIKEKFMDQANA